MMKISKLLSAVLFCVLISSSFSHAQHLSLLDIDTSGYPTMKASFYAIDKNYQQIVTLTKDNLEMKENGVSQQIVRVTNPEYRSPKSLSVLLTIDVSGSMGFLGININLAKMASKTLVSIMPLDQSECAITSFDDHNYVNTDFTRNKETLLKAIESLTPNGGTDYNAALTSPVSGAFDIAKKGVNEKVIIFLTDGIGEANDLEIIKRAKAEGVTIYCITLAMDTPEVLKKVAQQTGGQYFENILLEEDLKSIFSKILFNSEGLKPSTVEWISAPTCKAIKNLTFKAPSVSLSNDQQSYGVPKKGLVYLEKSTSFLNFKSIDLTKATTETFKLKALNSDMVVNSYSSNNPLFSIAKPTFPITIAKGSEQEVVVAYLAKDAAPQSATFELKSEGCKSVSFVTKSGSKVIAQTKNPVQVDFPNGKEVIYTNTDTIINWSGGVPNGTVKVLYSANGGKKWDQISSNTNEHVLRWKTPELATDSALVKVVQGDKANNESGTVTGFKKIYEKNLDVYPHRMKFSPANNLIVSENSTSINIIDLVTGKKLKSISQDEIKNGRYGFNADGSKLYFYNIGSASSTAVFDTKDLIKNDYTNGAYKVFVSSDLKVYLNIDLNGNFVIYDFETNTKLMTFPKIPGFEKTNLTSDYLMLYSLIDNYKDGVKYKIADKECILFDLNSQSIKCRVKTPESFFHSIEISKDQKYLVVATWGSSGVPFHVSTYDIETSKELYTHTSNKKDYGFISTGIELMACIYNNKPAVVEIATGKVIAEIEGDFDCGHMSPTDEYVIFGNSNTKNFALYSTGFVSTRSKVVNQDESDLVFKLQAPELLVTPINFGKIPVGESRDKVFKAVIQNPNPCKVQLNEIKIEGQDKSSFELVSEQTPFVLLPNQSQAIELRFNASKVGLHKAELQFGFGKKIISGKISGEGIAPNFAVQSNSFNLGKVLVGASKDTLLKGAIRNTGTTPIVISAIKMNGPDLSQFSLVSSKGFVLSPGEEKSIAVKFVAKKRGVATTQLYFDVQNGIGNRVVTLVAEGSAAASIRLEGEVVDASTNKSIRAEVICSDSKTGRILEDGNKGGGYSYTLFADRTYTLRATKSGYGMDSTIIDLQAPTQDLIVKRNLLLSPSNKTSVLLNGKVIDNNTKLPITAMVVIKEDNTQSRIDSILSDQDGNFSVALPFGKKYTVVVAKKEYMPEVSKVDLSSVFSASIVEETYSLSPILVGQSINLKNIYFERSKAVLLTDSYEQLNLLLALMQENSNMKIELSGHTDNQGDPKLNVKLSLERVEEIKRYLIGKGISKARITGKGFGGAFPIASNESEETRRLNRRVEFKIIGK